MGCVKTITAERFPAQVDDLGTRVEVCFHYDTSRVVFGTIIRHDSEEPHRLIIRLDTGRFILGTECQYKPVD